MRCFAALAVSMLVACNGELVLPDDDDAGTDAGLVFDDAAVDGGTSDAGVDASTPDAGMLDAGMFDAGLDAGTTMPDAGRDAGIDAGPRPPIVDVLAQRDGMFFTPSPTDPMMTITLGGGGTQYNRVEICFDVRAGDFQPQRPDPRNREEHILFNFFRNAPRHWGRYLMGSAAVSFLSGAPHYRMFGRTAIEDRGTMTYTTYTSVSARFAWQNGTVYHHCCSLDGVTHQQTCQLSQGGSVVATRNLAVDYLDPALHLTSGFYVELGAPPDTNGIETSPMGWVFSNLVVRAYR